MSCQRRDRAMENLLSYSPQELPVPCQTVKAAGVRDQASSPVRYGLVEFLPGKDYVRRHEMAQVAASDT